MKKLDVCPQCNTRTNTLVWHFNTFHKNVGYENKALRAALDCRKRSWVKSG